MNYSRPTNNTNDTRYQVNNFTAQVDSSGTYAVPNSQPFTTSTPLNRSPNHSILTTSGFNTTSASHNQTSSTQPPISDTCKWCYDRKRRHNHDTKDCNVFKNATSNEKWNTVYRHGLCMWCLQAHSVRDCPNGLNDDSRCNFCARSHNRTLGCRPSTNVGSQPEY